MQTQGEGVISKLKVHLRSRVFIDVGKFLIFVCALIYLIIQGHRR